VSGKVIRHFGPVHYFSLLSPARRHGWPCGPRAQATGTGRNDWRLTGAPDVDVYAYRDGQVDRRDRVTVSRVSDGHVMTRQRRAPTRPRSRPSAAS